MNALWSIALISFLKLVIAASRTSPPSGSYVVKSNPSSGEYSTVSAAVAALPADDTHQYIFIYPGVYKEQVYISRSGPTTIYGYTTDTSNYVHNQVNITHSVNSTVAGTDDKSGTLRNFNSHLSLYNINILNTYGTSTSCGSQAIAYSSQTNYSGAYGVGFYGCQDTIYANEGQQVYLQSYIEGAVDFIFGTRAMAYFEGNTIAIKGAGTITASGRSSNDNGSYLFNYNTIIEAPDIISSPVGDYYLGRPWSDYAKVIFKNTEIKLQINKALWSEWGSSDPNTEHVFYADYNTTGSGASDLDRASFATELTEAEAAEYNINTALGSGWQSWIDTSYLINNE